MLDELITDVLKAEGWDTYTNRANDRGGPTKWGITLRAWGDFVKEPVSDYDIRNIDEEDARHFYRTAYVYGPKFDQLPEPLLSLAVDSGVNHGPRAATKWVQRAIGARQDGVLGPKSFATLHYTDPLDIAMRVLASRIRLYGRLVTRDPSQAEFAHGWNNRAAKWLVRLADFYAGG